jgi:hypothetical protein
MRAASIIVAVACLAMANSVQVRVNNVNGGTRGTPGRGGAHIRLDGRHFFNQAPGALIEAAWASFRASLTGTYDTFTVTSSRGGSVTVTHPTEVQKLADGLNTATATLVTIDGVNWFVGLGCRQGGGFAVEFSNIGTCTCSSTVALRPDINDLNWGGVNDVGPCTFCGVTAGCPTQTITLAFLSTLS